MTTTKLGLPTIDGTMTADVVRDVNALAQAVDDKAGAPSGLAILDANSSVPAAQLGNVPVKSVNGETGDVVIQTFSGNYNDLSNKPFIPDTPDDIGAEPAITKKTAFNKDFGTSTGTVADGGVVAAHQADDVSHVKYGVATGTANTYAVTLDPAPTSYVEGMAVSVKINVDSTGASTLNVNGLGAKPIKKSNGNDVTNLKATGIYTLRYDGANFILQGEGVDTTQLVSVIGAPATINDDIAQLVADIQTAKNTLASKGAGANSDALQALANNIIAKKSASGVINSSSTTSLFHDCTGSNVIRPTVIVSGLGFKPSVVEIFQKLDGPSVDFTFFNINHDYKYSYYGLTGKILMGLYNQDSGGSVAGYRPVKLEGNAVVDDGTFTLPVCFNNVQYTWYAYE